MVLDRLQARHAGQDGRLTGARAPRAGAKLCQVDSIADELPVSPRADPEAFGLLEIAAVLRQQRIGDEPAQAFRRQIRPAGEP